jgi:hypothetical protein
LQLIDKYKLVEESYYFVSLNWIWQKQIKYDNVLDLFTKEYLTTISFPHFV